MGTLTHISHQGVLLAQYFAVAVAMLGMGLEGLDADQEVLCRNGMSKSPD